jgi:glycogen debranching enzyme
VTITDVDIKPGETIISRAEILAPGDPIFNPSNRPAVEPAISMILGWQNGYQVPFAAVPLAHHEGIAEQNLFRCLFGRDSLLVADLLKKRHPEIQENTLLALATVQGTKFDQLSEEEPGRIPHEVRELNDPRASELMKSGHWKFPYYGAVDATLIWLTTLARISAERPEFLDKEIEGVSLWQRAISATDWVIRRLQTPSGFIESNRSNPDGIQNQVWKDSGDSYMHQDGTLALGNSTASIETVAEAYDALQAVAQIMDKRPSIDWSISKSEILEHAEDLQTRVITQMFLGDRFALGTERDVAGTQRVFDSQASNQGRLLDSGILTGHRFSTHRQIIADAITGPGLLSETGLRTLSKDHPSYRPGGYHTGSAWPMDGIFASRGLVRHGFDSQARMIQQRVKKAIESFGGYPEFFRSDYPMNGLISTTVTDVTSKELRGNGHFNRIVQPPQIMQGWTIATYAWLTDNS